MSKEFNLSDYFDEDEALKAIAEEQGSGKFFRPNKDKTVLRILPPIKPNGEKLFYFSHKVHWINRVPYECINQTLVDKDGVEHIAEPCPICSLAKQLFKLGENDDEALNEAKAISAKHKDVVRVLVRGDGEDKIQFYEMPMSVKNLFLNAISSGDYGSPPIHPVTGNDFALQRTGSGKQTKYDSSYIMPKESPIATTKEGIIKIIQDAQAMPYNSILSFLDANSLKRVLREYSGETSKDVATETRTEKVAQTPKVGMDQPQGVDSVVESVNESLIKEPLILEVEENSLESLLSELTGLDEDLPF